MPKAGNTTSTPVSKRRRRAPLPANVIPFKRPTPSLGKFPSQPDDLGVTGRLLLLGARVAVMPPRPPEPARDRTPPDSVVKPMVAVLCQTIHTPRGRAVVEAMVHQLLARLDAQDAAQADMEPDADGEAEPDEASGQPATLAPVVVPLRRSLPRSGDQA